MLTGNAWHLVKLLFTLSLITVCVYLTDFNLVAQTLRTIEPMVYLIAFVVTFLGTILMPAIVTRLSLTASNIDINFVRLVAINLAIRFYILVLPRVAATGIRWYHYQKEGSGYEAAALILFERIIQILIVSAMGAIFLAFDLDTLGVHGYLLFTILITITVSLILVTLMFLSARFEQQVNWLQRLSARLPAYVSGKLEKLFTAIRNFRAVSKRDVWKILGISTLAYCLFVLSAWILLEALAVDIDIETLVWIRSVVFILTLIPISVGGIGVRDVSIIYYLQFFGISQEQGFAFSLALLSVQLLLGVWGALLELFQVILRTSKSAS